MKQPRAGRFAREIRGRCIRHGGQIDQSVLDGKRHLVGAVPAGDRNTLPAFLTPRRSRSAAVAARSLRPSARSDRPGRAPRPRRGCRGFPAPPTALRPAHEAAGTAAPLDQPGLASCDSALFTVMREQLYSRRSVRARTGCGGRAARRRTGCSSLMSARMRWCSERRLSASAVSTCSCRRAAVIDARETRRRWPRA